MLLGITGFEIRYQLRNPVFWVSIAVFFLLGFGLTASENVSIGTPGAVHENAPYAISVATALLSVFYLFVITAFVANAIVRDETSGFAPIVRATSVTNWQIVIGRWIGQHPPFPDSILVSTAVRAHQTWEIAWEAMKELVPRPRVEFLDELYGADPTHLLRIVRMASGTDPRYLMLVGHNPGMHELALTLTGSGDGAAKKALDANLPTAGLAIFDFSIDDWNDVAFRRGRLVRFTTPKLLKLASDD